MGIPYAEAAIQRYSHENVPQKIPPNPEENTHTEVRHQQSRRAADWSRTPTRALSHKHISPSPTHFPPKWSTLHKSTPKELHPRIAYIQKIQINLI